MPANVLSNYFSKKERTLKMINKLNKIQEKTGRILKSWERHSGWAPTSVSQIFFETNLKWTSELTNCLTIWYEDFCNIKLVDFAVNQTRGSTNNLNVDGKLILAYVNLGSIVENWLKFFLTIYYQDFTKSASSKFTSYIASDINRMSQESKKALKHSLEPYYEFKYNAFINKKTEDFKLHSPLKISFKNLIDFLEEDNIFNTTLIQWLNKIRIKRNIIHSYKDNKGLGDIEDFINDIEVLYILITEIEIRLPDSPPTYSEYM